MREKELIEVELIEVVDSIGLEYEKLGNNHLKRAACIKKDGLNPSKEMTAELSDELQLINLTLHELQSKATRLEFELQWLKDKESLGSLGRED